MSNEHNIKYYFDTLYRDDDDPWEIRHRWYERRKRALTLAALPHEHYARAFEPALRRTHRRGHQRERSRAHAPARRRTGQRAWPEGKLDLVVISELGYYLDEPQLWHVVDHIRRTLSPDGAVVACHWRKRIKGWSLDGDQVHAILRGRMSLPLLRPLLGRRHGSRRLDA